MADMPKPTNDRFEPCFSCGEVVDTAGRHSRVNVLTSKYTGLLPFAGSLSTAVGRGESDEAEAICQACALAEPLAYASRGF